MLRSLGKVLAGFLIGAIIFIGDGAYSAFNPQTPSIPLAAQVYRASVGITANLFLGYVNLTWLGADPTAIADSTPAFTEAATLSTNLTLDCGSYNVNSTITFSAGISSSLTGAAPNCVNIYKGTNVPVFQIDAARFKLADVSVFGNSSSPTVAPPQPISGTRSFSDTTSCIVVGVAGSIEPFGVHLTDVIADHCGVAGIDHEDGNSFVMSGNVSARHNGQWGYYKTTSCTFTNQCAGLPIAGIGGDVDQDQVDGILSVSDNGYAAGFTASGGAEFGASGNTGTIRTTSNYGDGLYVDTAASSYQAWAANNGVLLGTVSEWVTSHAYTTNQFVYYQTTTTSGFLYQATNSATSGGSPPTCSRGNTCSDGGVTWRNRGGMDVYMADNGLNTPSGFNANSVQMLTSNGNCVTAGNGNSCVVGSYPAAPPVGLVGSVSISQSAGLSIFGVFKGDQVTVASAIGGGYYTVPIPSAGLSMNGNTTGVGGMDTGTPPASGFLDLYWIYNPNTATLAMLGCADASCNGTAVYANGHLPTGYTASGLAAVLATDALKDTISESLLKKVVSLTKCPEMFGGTKSGTVALAPSSLLSAVPPEAINVTGFLSIASNTAGMDWSVASDTGGTGNRRGAGTIAGTTAVTACSGVQDTVDAWSFDVPVTVAQTIAWAEGGTHSGIQMNITGYTLP